MKKFIQSPIGVGVLAFIIVMIAGNTMKASGFHFQGLKVVRGGDVAVVSFGVDTDIFINQKIVSSKDNDRGSVTLVENVQPGTHDLLVFNEAYWPWKKNITVNSDETTSVSPFLVRRNASGIIVTNKDPEYTSLRNQVLTNTVPTKASPKKSKSGLVEIWTEGNVAMARWTGSDETVSEYFCTDENICNKEVSVVTSPDTIRNLDFYKSEDGVLIVSFSNGVFAIEIDKRGGTQNFQPIYKGTELPRFSKSNDDTINVIDGSAIFIIDL